MDFEGWSNPQELMITLHLVRSLIDTSIIEEQSKNHAKRSSIAL